MKLNTNPFALRSLGGRAVAVRRLSGTALAVLGAVSLVAAGCGQAKPTTTAAQPTPSVTAAATTYPLTIDNCGEKVTFTAAPKRVVILNGTSVAEVESLITLGVQDRVVANSQSYGVSDDPQMVDKVKAVPTGGVKINQNFEVPREQVLALKPDLVISTWAGGFDDKIGSITRAQLTAAGINSYVTPVNCASGAVQPRPQDKQKHDAQSVDSSFELLLELGVIFDVQRKAVDYVSDAKRQLADVQNQVRGKPAKSVLVVYPGMSMMNKNGLPAVFGGGIYDDIVTRAGGTNAFAGKTSAELAEINLEALASAKVEVLVIGLFQPGEDPKAMAAELFKKFPQWPASKTNNYTSVSDSIYLGPLNATAVHKISAAVHA